MEFDYRKKELEGSFIGPDTIEPIPLPKIDPKERDTEKEQDYEDLDDDYEDRAYIIKTLSFPNIFNKYSFVSTEHSIYNKMTKKILRYAIV